ncbi:unnamed protein product [Enterobius vermicularis]|uniref:Bacteriocin immunity protein n=1 Tax=Enterobius vermicularis TaxID=51028 RepID=A0A0N4UVK9_ENTVE|nr:unnamed protein product [Enterobius vermicularis]
MQELIKLLFGTISENPKASEEGLVKLVENMTAVIDEQFKITTNFITETILKSFRNLAFMNHETIEEMKSIFYKNLTALKGHEFMDGLKAKSSNLFKALSS